MDEVSIVVPLAPGERKWRQLVGELQKQAPAAEIILVSPEASPADLSEGLLWVCAPRGRARQLNAGAARATRVTLWFLHADTRLGPGAVEAVTNARVREPAALHYFDLRFTPGAVLMKFNTWGVWLRSHVLALPFGDQGFFMSREVFEKLGRFREDAPYGEDHLLIWAAHQAGVPVRAVAAHLLTSARKYRERGWLATTWRHGVLTVRQAWPEWRRLRRAQARGYLRRQMPSVAVVAFVKTPEYSAVKTRLAAGVGRATADEFYALALDCVEAVLQGAAREHGMVPYWAVAEECGLKQARWRNFAKISQGEGGLGTRLSRVYRELRAHHDIVLIIGADSPQLTADYLRQAAAMTRPGVFVLGEAHDGGFALFGGSTPVSAAHWEGVPYSASNTAAKLAGQLASLGRIHKLPSLCDVDDCEDLVRLAAELESLRARQLLLPSQERLLHWIGALQD